MIPPRDKRLHLVAGLLIGLSALVLPLGWAAGLVVLTAGGEEAFDAVRHGKPDVLDAVATIAGGIVTIGVISALMPT